MRNFLCFGCGVDCLSSPKDYSNLDSSSDYPSSSDVSLEINNGDDLSNNSDQIPKPDMFTGRVQPPPDIEVIDESLIIGDFDYSQFPRSSTTVAPAGDKKVENSSK